MSGAAAVMAVLVVATHVGTSLAGADPVPDRVVFPTGGWPADVANVQAAADLGGTVLLKAVNVQGKPTPFNFGTPEALPGRSVRLTTEVAILGETVGAARTTVRGGNVPFFGVSHSHTRIERLNFVSPRLSAVIVIASTGAEIVGNRVSRVVGAPLPFGLSEGRGFKFLGNNDPDGAITGKVVVSGNVIEDLHADLSDAIVFDAVAADVDIVGNRIETVQSGGILVIDSAGAVRIAGNDVVPGPGDPGEFSIGNGVVIVGSRGASYSILGNRVVAENPAADGILLIGDLATIVRPVLQGNEVTMGGSEFGAITFLDSVAHSSVSGNVIGGRGATALGVFVAGLAASPAAPSNVFSGNDTTGFEPSLADVFLDTHTSATVILGCTGTVIDLGAGNQAFGCPPALVGSGVSGEGEGRDRRVGTLRSTAVHSMVPA
jgi:hypothetical protein